MAKSNEELNSGMGIHTEYKITVTQYKKERFERILNVLSELPADCLDSVAIVKTSDGLFSATIKRKELSRS